VVVVTVVALIVGGVFSSAPPSAPLSSTLASLGHLDPPPPQGSLGPEGVPIPAVSALAGTSTIASGSTVDGISCEASEQVLFHIHAHLTVFVNGAQHQIPYGIGIPGAQVQNTAQGPFVVSGTCFYWLHTHADDGIIHIESPVQRIYTLGDFFDIWGKQLGPNEIGPYAGHVIAIYNGRLFVGNPRNIPLTAHAQIQLELGRPLIAPVSISFPSGL